MAMEQEKLNQSMQATHQTIQISLPISQRSLINVLLDKDKIQLAQQIGPYLDRGKPNFPAIFSVPRENRLPAMAEENLAGTLTIVSTTIGLYLAGSGVNESLAVDIAEAVLDDAHSDQLTLQD